MSTVITVENLGKKYTLRHQSGQQPYVALRDVITERAAAIGRKLLHPFSSSPLTPHTSQEEFWALKDISFEVKQGDRIGIIGRNGAGKSTLLKILSRIIEPTTGSVRIKGRVASLLEVGTGFHPELTGRENIYLNGAILGMHRAEIKKKFDEIVDFAEIEKFLDTPVKRYSSGMYVRLAFAVAAHLEPEILVVDEVLAVGDAQFQKKCLGKMEDVSSREGRTVLFVSHNMPSIRLLCNKTVLMAFGCLKTIGESNDIVEKYLTDNLETKELLVNLCSAHRSAGTQQAVEQAWIEDDKGNIVNKLLMGCKAYFCFEYHLDKELTNPDYGFGFETTDGTRIFSVNTKTTVVEKMKCPLHGVVRCHVPEVMLMPGTYLVSLAIVDNQIEWVDYVERAVSFEVLPDDIYGTGKLYDRSQGIVFTHSIISVSDV